jgi:hypothetical protein
MLANVYQFTFTHATSWSWDLSWLTSGLLMCIDCEILMAYANMPSMDLVGILFLDGSPVLAPSILVPSDGVFGRFDLVALCGCHTLNVGSHHVCYGFMAWAYVELLASCGHSQMQGLTSTC